MLIQPESEYSMRLKIGTSIVSVGYQDAQLRVHAVGDSTLSAEELVAPDGGWLITEAYPPV